MSFTAMAWASKQTTGKALSKFILLMLADRANSEGLCYPSLKRIASDCEMSKPTVVSHIKKLEELGLITVIRRRQDGVDLPNHYKMEMGSKIDEGVVKDINGGSKAPLQGGSKGALHKPISSFNLSENLPPTPQGGNEYSEEFNKFWEYYGRKGNKQLSWNQWKKLKDVDKDEIRDKLPTYIRATEKRYRKNAETYLNVSNKHWNNEVVDTSSTPIEQKAVKMTIIKNKRAVQKTTSEEQKNVFELFEEFK